MNWRAHPSVVWQISRLCTFESSRFDSRKTVFCGGGGGGFLLVRVSVVVVHGACNHFAHLPVLNAMRPQLAIKLNTWMPTYLRCPKSAFVTLTFYLFVTLFLCSTSGK